MLLTLFGGTVWLFGNTLVGTVMWHCLVVLFGCLVAMLGYLVALFGSTDGTFLVVW